MFKKTKCSKCDYEYDETFSECPNCSESNKNLDPLFSHITMLSLPKQIGLLFTGWIGINIFAIIVDLILGAAGLASLDEIRYEIIFESVTYAITFLVLVAIINIDFKKLFKSFKNWKPYVAGIGAVILMLCFNVIYNIILSACGVKIEIGTNQTFVEELEAAFPAVTVVIFGFVAPICEELTYRVGMFSFLKRISKWLAYIVTMLIFGLIHMKFAPGNIVNELLNLPFYIVPGLILTFVYDRYGFAGSLTAHILNNILPYVLSVALLGGIR